MTGLVLSRGPIAVLVLCCLVAWLATITSPRNKGDDK